MSSNPILASLSVLLILSIASATYFYMLQPQDLAITNESKKQIAELQSEFASLGNNLTRLQTEKSNLETNVSTLTSEVAGLDELATRLQTENTNLQNQTAALQSQIESAHDGLPKIVTRLGARDVRNTPAPGHPWSGQIRLYVAGEVWNVGTGPARNCKLHIILYQGNNLANETYAELGTIEVGGWADVAVNIYYNGDALTSWTLIPTY